VTARGEAPPPAPLFLVGAPRSGTTLLYKALCLHPEVAWISNWARRAPGVPALALFNRVPPRLPQARRTAWFGPGAADAYAYNRRRPVWERLFPAPVEGEPIYRHCGVGEDGQGPPDPRVAARLRRCLADLQRFAGGSLLISKRIANNRRIPLLAAAFPEARFVHLIRDGRAVAFSLSRVDWWQDEVVWWYGDTPRRWTDEGGNPWELCARHWLRELAAIDEGLQAVPAGQRLEIRYEDLVEAPVAGVRRVAAFAGLAEDPGWTAELGRLRYPNRNEAWRDKLPADVRALIEDLQLVELRRLGHVGS
jgi:Sulfotransferase family